MALKQGKECCTKWTHVESGSVLVRRIHRFTIQARNGGLYTIRGEELPDIIPTSAGRGHKGAHHAQIIMNPAKTPRRTPHVPVVGNPYPSVRDLANAGLGFWAFRMLKFAASVLGLSQ